MRKILLVSLLWVSSGFGVIHAGYIIKLKNGNEYVTERYWQRGTQVLFDTDGGVFGVDKRFVAKIEKSDRPVRPITESSPKSSPNALDANERIGGEVKRGEAESKPEATVKRNEEDPILRHFQIVKERAKNIDGLLTSELNQLAKDLADLKRAMQLSGKTNEFLAEFGQLHDIADRVEEALKARR